MNIVGILLITVAVLARDRCSDVSCAERGG